MKSDSGNQQPDILDTPKQKRFNYILGQTKEEQRNTDMSLFKDVLGYETPGKILQTLHNLKRADSYNQEAFSIENIVVNFGNRVKKMSEGVNKNKGQEILTIVSKILDFCLNERNQQRFGLKILIPNQMHSRLPVCLSQLKAGNNSEKLSGNHYIFCTDQKYLQRNSIKL